MPTRNRTGETNMHASKQAAAAVSRAAAYESSIAPLEQGTSTTVMAKQKKAEGLQRWNSRVASRSSELHPHRTAAAACGRRLLTHATPHITCCRRRAARQGTA